jgi:hypothetical protein
VKYEENTAFVEVIADLPTYSDIRS